MFYRKLVALLLLGFYGIPAALGPYWHHHGCAEQACVSQHNPTSEAGSHSAQASHHCSCQHHQHVHAVKAAKPQPKPVACSEDCGQTDGPCVICAFYASAQTLPTVFELTSQCELVSVIELLEPSVPSKSQTVAQARGPPAWIAKSLVSRD